MEAKMEDKNLNRYQDREKNEPKIGLTRDGKSIIIRIPGLERPVFKAVAYMEKVIESAKKRQANAPINIEKI